MGLHDILLALLLLAGIIFLVVGTVVLLRLMKTMEAMRAEAQRFREEATPLLRKMQDVADEAEHSLSIISRNGDTITTSVQRFKTMVDRVYHLHDLLYGQLAPSVTGLAATLAGIRRGLQTFFDQLRQPS
jgi:hypothetical protein